MVSLRKNEPIAAARKSKISPMRSELLRSSVKANPIPGRNPAHMQTHVERALVSVGNCSRVITVKLMYMI